MEKPNPGLLYKAAFKKQINKIIRGFPHREDPITWLESLTQPHHGVFKMFRLQHQRNGAGSAPHHPFLSLNQRQHHPQKSSFPTKVQKHQEKDPFLSSAPAPPRQLNRTDVAITALLEPPRSSGWDA